ncbi:MAG: oligosaccharide flippase family protein [Candidatus Paceibacterota bacterium]
MAETLKRTIGVGTAWTSGSTLVLKVVGLATIFIMLRKLNVYEYGLAELVLSILGIMSIFSIPGLSPIVIADMGIAKAKRDLRAMKELFVNFFLLQISLGFVAWAIVFFGSDIIAHYFSEHAGGLFKIVSFAFLISPFRSLFMVAFSVELKFFHRSLYSVLEEIFKLVVIWVLLYLVGLRVSAVIWSVVLSQFLVMIPMALSLLKCTRYFRSVTLVNKKAPWSLFYDHGKWGIFATYFNSLGQNIRLWIIKVMLGTEAVGIFAVANGLLQHTVSLVNLSSVLGPILPQHVNDKERFARIATKAIKYQVFAFVCTAIVAYFIFVPIVAWMFPNYLESLPLFRAMLPVVISLGFATVFTPMFAALQAQKSLFWAISVKTVMILLLLPVSLFYFGIMGVAYEFFLTTMIFVFERYRALKRVLPGFSIRIRRFFEFDTEDAVILDRIKIKLIGYLNK